MGPAQRGARVPPLRRKASEGEASNSARRTPCAPRGRGDHAHGEVLSLPELPGLRARSLRDVRTGDGGFAPTRGWEALWLSQSRNRADRSRITPHPRPSSKPLSVALGNSPSTLRRAPRTRSAARTSPRSKTRSVSIGPCSPVLGG